MPQLLLMLIIAFFFSSLQTYAQHSDRTPMLDTSFDKREIELTNNPLFVHFDKTIYVPNEEVWFTGYLLSSSLRIGQYHTMFLSLVSSSRRQVYFESKFVVLNGRVFGDFVIPDSLPPGDYNINCYTNLVDTSLDPAQVFSQRITVKETRDIHIEASLDLKDTATGKQRTAVLTIAKFDKKKPKYIVSYSFGLSKTVSQFVNESSFVIPIPDTIINEVLNVEVKKGKRSVILDLPLPQRKLKVQFFPEGGYLVNGLLSTIAWECKTMNGMPEQPSAILYRNGSVVDTLETGVNGIGRFKIVPNSNDKYSLKIRQKKDVLVETYELPKALDRGCVLALEQSVFRDTVSFNIASTQMNKLKILVHNYRDIIASQNLEIGNQTKRVKILIDSNFKGLASICVLDSMGMPIAERMIFVSYESKMPVDLILEKAQYNKREKVKLEIKLLYDRSDTIIGFSSISCVQDNRIKNADHQNITSFFFVERFIDKLSSSLSESQFNDLEFMEDLLLVKGWSRYTWQSSGKRDTGSNTTISLPLTVGGQVKKFNNRLKTAVTLSLLGKKSFSIFSTDNKGNFSIPRDQVIVSTSGKLTLIVVGESPSNYKISFDRKELLYNKIIAEKSRFQFPETKVSTNVKDHKISEFERAQILDEVIVRSSNDQSIFGIHRSSLQKNCLDYVCAEDNLNCPAHVPAGKPTIGHKYLINGQLKAYTGCLSNVKDNNGNSGIEIPAVFFSKEFYPLDEASVNSVNPQFISTVYWNHSVKLTSVKATQIEFYTGDITGKFRIVVQGLTSNGPIFTERYFSVKEN